LKAFLSSFATVFVSSLWISIAAAQPPQVHLVWERPVGSLCPSRAALESDVEQVLGRHIFTPRADAGVIVRGVIDDGSTEARVRIDARSSNGVLLGTRELIAPTGRCASLRGAIALVLTLFVDRDDGSDAAAGADADIRGGFGVHGEVVSSPLPRATIAVGPAFSLEVGHVFGLHADAAYWIPVSIETQRGVGAKLAAFSLALRACARFWGSRVFGLQLCGGAEMGALVVSPLRIEGPARQIRLLGHAVLDLRLEAQLASFAAVDVAIGPLLSFSRPALSYVGGDGARMPVYRPQLGGILFQLTFIILGS
jgi:hypothetical protein